MSIVKGIKVGSADITGTYNSTSTLSDTEHLDVVAVSLGSIDTPSNTTYDGTYQYPTPTVTATVDGTTVSLVKDQDYTLSYENNLNAGQATVTATGINNFSGTVSSHWTISSADITVTSENQTYTYTGSPQGYGISVSVVSGVTPTIRYGLTSGTYDLTTAPTFTNVPSSGNYYTVYYQVTADNHNTQTGSYTVTITPLTTTLVWGDTSWMYDGNAHQTTCTVGNLVSGDTCTVILSGNSITNIGTTTVTATGLSSNNYALPVEQRDRERTLTITAGMFVKLSGIWTPVKEVYKKVSGHWVKQDFGSAFSVEEKYVKID